MRFRICCVLALGLLASSIGNAQTWSIGGLFCILTNNLTNTNTAILPVNNICNTSGFGFTFDYTFEAGATCTRCDTPNQNPTFPAPTISGQAGVPNPCPNLVAVKFTGNYATQLGSTTPGVGASVIGTVAGHPEFTEAGVAFQDCNMGPVQRTPLMFAGC